MLPQAINVHNGVTCGVCEMAPIVGTRHRKRQAAFAGPEALEALKAEELAKQKEEVQGQYSAEEIKEIEAQQNETLEEILTKQLAEDLDGKPPEEQWQELLDMLKGSYDLCEGCHAALPAEKRQFEAL